MKDTLTITKMTELFRVAQELVGLHSFPMEEFTKDVTFDQPSDAPQVLRELTSEEASLFYTDYSLFRALQQKTRSLNQSGVSPFESPGGLFYKVTESLCGLGVTALSLMVLREFAGDKRLEGQWRTVRVELVDDALCFTAVSLSPEEMAEVRSQAIKMVIAAGESISAAASDKINENFNLEAWNTDGKKFQ